MPDTHQTHVNVFKQDVEKAHQMALGAVDELKRCIDALEGKYRSLLAELRPGDQNESQEDPNTKKKLAKSGADPNA